MTVTLQVSSLLETINSAPGVEGDYWFRKLHVQPRDSGSSSSRAGAETVVFLTALDLATNTFVDKTAAGGIIE